MKKTVGALLFVYASVLAFSPSKIDSRQTGAVSTNNNNHNNPLSFGRQPGATSVAQRPIMTGLQMAFNSATTTPCPEIALRPRMGMEMAVVACG